MIPLMARDAHQVVGFFGISVSFTVWVFEHHEQRVPVGRSISAPRRFPRPPCTGAVLDDEGLAEGVGRAARDEATIDVGGAADREKARSGAPDETGRPATTRCAETEHNESDERTKHHHSYLE